MIKPGSWSTSGPQRDVARLAAAAVLLAVLVAAGRWVDQGVVGR